MMNLETVAKELESKGFETRLDSVTKNGIEIPCVSVKQTENLWANIYENSIDGMTIDEIVEMVSKKPDFDVNVINAEFILANVRIGVQAKGTETLIKRSLNKFDGIEKYLYCVIGDFASFKLKPSHLALCGLEKSEVWKVAEENTYNATVLNSLIGLQLGLKGTPLDETYDTDPMFTIVTNKEGTKGAGIIAVNKAIKKLKSLLGTKEMLVIPSSIHEVIVMAKFDGMDIEDIKKLVFEINANEVRETDKLIDNAYVI